MGYHQQTLARNHVGGKKDEPRTSDFVNSDFITNNNSLSGCHFQWIFSVGMVNYIFLIFLGWGHIAITGFVKDRVVILHKLGVPTNYQFCEKIRIHKFGQKFLKTLIHKNRKQSTIAFWNCTLPGTMAPKKRTSGGPAAGGKAKAQKTTKGSGAQPALP